MRGATARTRIPAPSGRRKDFRIATATAAGVTGGLKERYLSRRCSEAGTVAMASSDVVNTRLKTYGASPPSLMSFRGSSGAPAQMARITSATSVGRGRSRVRAMRTATTGATTYMARTDFARRTGRRQSQVISFTVTLIPVAKRRTATETFSAITSMVPDSSSTVGRGQRGSGVRSRRSPTRRRAEGARSEVQPGPPRESCLATARLPRRPRVNTPEP